MPDRNFGLAPGFHARAELARTPRAKLPRAQEQNLRSSASNAVRDFQALAPGFHDCAAPPPSIARRNPDLAVPREELLAQLR